ncbi:HAD-IA family hydrolase [Shewanella sp. SR44-3]|uniref:HAD-IA family hydrolase n=1 Tax=Shewanella sp. SR44-3 TaxID=2760936 RepID=UPI0015FE36A8|nr:HAD-IA family hydrolase [Shewanella sp. SR44-3]MBB1269611.1 HAD-IA family hydrolase [Shewanella sp. SR44-3]
MKQYLRLRSFKAISFDLDDTLYHNTPYLQLATDKFFTFLNQDYPKTQTLTPKDWLAIKHHLFELHPELKHDTSAARYAMVHDGLMSLGYQEREASEGAQKSMACFHFYRSDFIIDAKVLAILKQLAESVTLIGISNGNVDASRIGLSESLAFVQYPGHGVKMKPHGDMFALACQRLGIASAELLHVGDHQLADVSGARRAGCQSVWFNPEQLPLTRRVGCILPHVELSDLNQLLNLV